LPRLDGEGLVEAGEDIAVGDPRAGMKLSNRDLFDILQAIERGVNTDASINTRRVVFLQGQNTSRSLATDASAGEFLDPWGSQYCVAMDYSGDLRTKVGYLDFANDKAPKVRAAAFSVGPDGKLGLSGNPFSKKGDRVSDDVLSW